MDNTLKLRQMRKSALDEIGLTTIQQDAILSRINCHNIGKILEFDKTTQTCTVELMQIKQYNGKLYTPAPITQVPLIIYGAGNGHITLPDPVGTYCLLLFLDRNSDNFFMTGEQYTPDTTRMHDYTDCVALTTFKTVVNPLTDYDDKAVSILNSETIEDTTYNSSIKVYGNEIKAASDSLSINTENNTSIVSALGGQITAGEKITIQNTARNLNTLIQSFITACEGITTVNGGGLTPECQQTFTDLKSQFEELLQ